MVVGENTNNGGKNTWAALWIFASEQINFGEGNITFIDFFNEGANYFMLS